MTVADPKIQFMDIGSEMLNYFESNLGRIEILGSSNKIERIYFNIQSSSLDQWEAPQIRESKRQFIFDVVVDDGGEKGKMEEFVNFCEVSYSLESVDSCQILFRYRWLERCLQVGINVLPNLSYIIYDNRHFSSYKILVI